KTKLRLEWLQGQVICSPGVRSCGETPDLSLFLGEIGFRFVELRPVGSWTADFGELGVKRLRVACIAGGLRGASGAQKAIEPVWRILQDGFVFGEGIGGTLEFEEHVREHFARRDADGFAVVLFLMVGGSAQLLKSLVWFPLSEGQPGFSLAEVRGFFVSDAVALFSRSLLTVSYKLRQFF